MESIPKQIFLGKTDNFAHLDFVKFGKGIFKNKYLVDAKRQKDKWSLKTSAEFANFLVRECLAKASGEIKIKGVIVATFNIAEEISFGVERVKQFMGIKQAIINTTTSPKNILDLMDRFPKAFFALSFSVKDCDLKIKAKAPKSAKPSAKGGKGPMADFCSLKTTNEKIAGDLLFGIGDFKEVKINHTIMIDQIILPKGETDPVKIRGNAQRKGKLIRATIVDGNEKVSEKEFLI
ncbi:hypothetical protein ACFLZZ_04700 [Nanoarchaeota archaeon]